MSKTIWLRVRLPEKELLSLQQEFSGCELRQADDADVDSQWLSRVDGVFTEEAVPDEVVQRMTHLKWLHVTRGGVNVYLTPTVKARPIQVTGSKGIHGTVFSEFALASIFMLAKRLAQCVEAQRQKKWQKFQPVEVDGKTVGIVGLGTVGDQLARKAKALGMRVIATRRTATAKPDYVDELGTPEFMPKLLERADYVVLLLASVPSTVNIIGEKELRLMKPSAYFINLTGGRAVDEKSLVRALKEKWFAGAVLDAFAKQPLPEDSELWTLPNVIITPRIAGITSQKWPAVLPVLRENLRRFLAGEPLRNIVNKELGY
ncbi:MAG TPA: D-2-hydroxyacid dehydrogenase [Candidatus Limnocylindrales bacterium]|nr:D-2-hydroxyacid dehydrogenase [Candidatus Limnocylindrales bacterium]